MSTGSVYQRQSDGRWVAAISFGSRRIMRYAKTEREAREKFKQLIADDVTGTLAPPSKLTLQGWAEQWLGSIERRPSTLNFYRSVLRPVLVEVGSVKLGKLTSQALALTFAKLRRAGRGTRCIQQAYTVLGTCLRAAVLRGVLSTNPLERVEKPRHEARRLRVWTLEETQRFVATCDASASQYAPLCTFLVGTGLRLSEALGLRWGDINDSTVRVQRALVYAAGRAPTMQATKSRAGVRVITLTAPAAKALARIPRGVGERPVFVSRTETTPSYTAVRDALRTLCSHANVPVLNLHALRHVHASTLVAAGADIASVSRRLGHAQISTTVNIYTHAITRDWDAAEIFNRALGRT